MSSNKHLIIAIALCGAVMAAGWFIAVRPVYGRVRELQQEASDHRRQAANLAVREDEIEKLQAELDALRHRIDHVLKRIPPRANVNEVSRRWAFPIDNVTVLDRDYTAGTDRPACPNSDVGFMVAPMTVTIVGTFDAIYSLVRVAESLPQLVRVTSVEIKCQRSREDGQPIGEATIVLEVVYEPAAEGKGV